MESFRPLIFEKNNVLLYVKRRFMGHFIDGGGGGGGIGSGSSPPRWKSST